MKRDGLVFQQIFEGECFGTTEFIERTVSGRFTAVAACKTHVLQLLPDAVRAIVSPDTVHASLFYWTLCQVCDCFCLSVCVLPGHCMSLHPLTMYSKTNHHVVIHVSLTRDASGHGHRLQRSHGGDVSGHLVAEEVEISSATVTLFQGIHLFVACSEWTGQVMLTFNCIRIKYGVYKIMRFEYTILLIIEINF